MWQIDLSLKDPGKLQTEDNDLLYSVLLRCL